MEKEATLPQQLTITYDRRCKQRRRQISYRFCYYSDGIRNKYEAIPQWSKTMQLQPDISSTLRTVNGPDK